ncbi:MAG: hypothetical protein CL484_00245 [Acidobacteria bacterium]|mgnify:CR=1 FL=1|nr:hypothetical protein [Acidobacteriota bacterium]
MSGFGLAPFGISTFGLPAAALPGESVSPLGSSRLIDKFGRYVLNSEGGFATMDDLHQRIVLLLAYNFTMPALVGEDFSTTIGKRVRVALAPLIQGREPRMVLKRVEADWAAGSSRVLVTFYDPRANTTETITVNPTA